MGPSTGKSQAHRLPLNSDCELLLFGITVYEELF